MSYEDIVAPYLKPGFVFRELVHDGLHNKQRPPARMHSRIVPALELANTLRMTMMGLGAHGLLIHAAYRPMGGAANSQHKHNRALDLDLLPQDYDLAEDYYREATRLWCMVGIANPVGLGLYCSKTKRGGIRVHLDVGYSTRTWQNTGPHAVRPPIALRIAAELGMASPIRKKAGNDE